MFKWPSTNGRTCFESEYDLLKLTFCAIDPGNTTVTASYLNQHGKTEGSQDYTDDSDLEATASGCCKPFSSFEVQQQAATVAPQTGQQVCTCTSEADNSDCILLVSKTIASEHPTQCAG